MVLDQYIPRARLGLHLRLAELSDNINQALDAGNASEAARLMSAYFDLVGLDTAGANGVQALWAYLKLAALNQLQALLPFQKWEGPPHESRPYDYAGRVWAWWIHKLATRYGWSRDEIFGLWPEEAAAYLQEILISEYDEADDARSLTELGYSYDKVTKKATFRPVPRPGWMIDRPEKKVRIRKDMIPIGVVIDLSELRPEDTTVH